MRIIEPSIMGELEESELSVSERENGLKERERESTKRIEGERARKGLKEKETTKRIKGERESMTRIERESTKKTETERERERARTKKYESVQC